MFQSPDWAEINFENRKISNNCIYLSFESCSFDHNSYQQLLSIHFICLNFRQTSIFKSPLKCQEIPKNYKKCCSIIIRMIIKSKQNVLVTQLAEFDFGNRKIGKKGQFHSRIWFLIQVYYLRTTSKDRMQYKHHISLLLKAYYVVKNLSILNEFQRYFIF